jgi:iron complex outermembrane receptor protein
MQYRPLALAIAALFSFPTLAAEPVVSKLGEIVVVAPQDLEAAAQTVKTDTIRAARPATSDSASLLRDVPGVSLYGAGGISSLPVIHGLADDRLRTKVDGTDLIAACPNHMNPALSYIDPTKVESVKVYAGVTPVSVGGDSIGGSIVVESAQAKFAKPGEGLLTTGQIGAFYRSNGNAKGANVNVNVANDTVSVGYTASVADADNYKAGGEFKSAIYTSAANAPYTGRAGHTLALDEVGSTAYKSFNSAVNVAVRNDHHLFDLKVQNQNLPFENFVNQRMDMTNNDNNQINLGYTGDYQWGLLKARAYREMTNHEMDFGDDKRYWYGSASGGPSAVNAVPCSPISSTCAAGMPMNTKSKTVGLSINAELPLSERDTLRVGSEYQAYQLDDWWPPSGAMMYPGTFWNIQDGERDRLAVFGEWEAKINAQWTSQLGARFEKVEMNAGNVNGYAATDMNSSFQLRDSTAFNALDHKKSDNNLDLTVLTRYTPSASLDYELGLAQKTRSPNVYERYTWSTWQMAALMNNFVGDGNGYVGNLNLKPEVAHTLSLVADWHDAGNKAWGVRVAPYYTRVKDYVDAVQWDATTNAARTVPVVNNFTVLKFVNQSAQLYGIDLSGHAQVAQATAYGDFEVSGVLNYARGQNRQTGDNLYNIMPLNTKLALSQKFGGWKNGLEIQYVAAKDTVSRVRNEIKTDAYTLFNLRSSYEWKKVRLDFGIDNLFDRNYDLPLGGAYLGQGTTMTIGSGGVIPQWGTAVPGPGRSIYAGVNVKF